MRSGKIRVKPVSVLEKGKLYLALSNVDILGVQTNVFKLVRAEEAFNTVIGFDGDQYDISHLYEFYLLDEEDKTQVPLHQDYYDSYWRFYASRSYMNRCSECKKEFLGAKMQMTCRSCLATYYEIENGVAIPNTDENTRRGIFDNANFTEEEIQKIIDYVKERDPEPAPFLMYLLGKGFDLRKKNDWNF